MEVDPPSAPSGRGFVNARTGERDEGPAQTGRALAPVAQRVPRSREPSPWFAAQPEMQRLTGRSVVPQQRPAEAEDLEPPQAVRPSGEGTARRRASDAGQQARDAEREAPVQPSVASKVIRGRDGRVRPKSVAELEREYFSGRHARPAQPPQRLLPPPRSMAAPVPAPQPADEPEPGAFRATAPSWSGFDPGRDFAREYADFETAEDPGPSYASGNFTEASPWFTRQPEFQRLKRGAGSSQYGEERRFARWPVIALGVAGLAAAAWYFMPGDVSIREQLAWLAPGQNVSRSEPAPGASGAAVDVEQTVRPRTEVTPAPAVQDRAATRALPDPQLPPGLEERPAGAQETAKRLTGRAPTAVGPVVPQSGNSTRLEKNDRASEASAAGFTNAIDLRPPAIAAPSAGAARQSVLSPSGLPPVLVPGAETGSEPGGLVPDTLVPDTLAPDTLLPNTLAPSGNPFETFSSGGAGPRSERVPSRPAGTEPVRTASLTLPDSVLADAAVSGGIEGGIEEARQALLAGDAGGAGRVLDDVLASDPDNIDALMLHGEVLNAIARSQWRAQRLWPCAGDPSRPSGRAGGARQRADRGRPERVGGRGGGRGAFGDAGLGAGASAFGPGACGGRRHARGDGRMQRGSAS